MKARRFMGLVLACAMAPVVAQAEDNPFIPVEPGKGLGQIERRLNDLEMRVRHAEMRAEESMLESQFPTVRMDSAGAGAISNALRPGDVVIGRLNGDCLVKRTDAAGRSQVKAMPDVQECVTPDEPEADSEESNETNRQR